ncbi:hypothetical protein N752_04540 [Desulforamulus aquiferis]|nr:hypothetical protein [Desulforamulus aquiferis]RYD06161.1 hypothetical protein N752_04540 [Desulforamulus aquiferis]
MLEQLQADYGKKITIELVNGRKISGKIIAVSEQFVRLESNEGIGTVPISAIQVVWESVQNLTEENMDYLAEKLRKSTDENRINCTSVSGFTCLNQYVCIPPDNCVYTFACPGVYTPAGPQAGCPRFQFYQPCGFRSISYPAEDPLHSPATSDLFHRRHPAVRSNSSSPVDPSSSNNLVVPSNSNNLVDPFSLAPSVQHQVVLPVRVKLYRDFPGI